VEWRVGDSIRNKFASPVLGLPQEEPIFIKSISCKVAGRFMSVVEILLL
jgi:hypothetical protein